jgi:co-chaperonin GroES (HSP10)
MVDVKDLKPLYDNVVMEAIKESNRGGIEIPLTAQQQVLTRARVLAVGDGKFDVEGKRFVPMTLAVGDIVYINSYLGMKLKLDPKTELIVQKEEEIRVRLSSGATQVDGAVQA